MRPLLTISFVVAVLSSAGACSDGASDSTFDGGANGGDGSTSGDGGFVLPDNDGSTKGGDGGVLGDGGFTECAATSAKADGIPLHFVVLFDRSGSMCNSPAGYNCGAADTRFKQAVPAMQSFFSAPAAAGTYASLLLFPTADGGPDNDANAPSCQTTAVPATPEVTLPDANGVLLAALNAKPPQVGNTPTKSAVTKALSLVASQNAALRDGGKSVLILVTDGRPEMCQEGASAEAVSQDVKALLATAKSQGISTYVVGLSFGDAGLQANLTTMAQGAGTAPIFVSNPAQVQAELAAALGAIRGQVLSCEYKLPPPPAGEMLDTTKINVNYNDGAGTVTPLLHNQDCAGGMGWQYDNEVAPTRVLLCGTTCTTAKGNTKASIAVAFGCATAESPR